MERRIEIVCLSRCVRLLAVAVACSAASAAYGWIYPEHRDIAIVAVEGLDLARRAGFDRLWQEARWVPTPSRAASPAYP